MEEIAENPQTQDAPETSVPDITELNNKGYKLYPKVKLYDVIFKRFFESDENLKKLYESISNRKIRVEDIERVTLEEGKSFETQMTNDLGFLVKNADGQDEFLFLVEAQSTWNDNMPYRFWDYLVEIFRKYTRDHHLDKHGDVHFFLPRPCFYLIYTGSGDKPDKLSFAEKMFRSGKRDNFDLDFGIHVISSPDSKTVPGQYVGFSKIVSRLRKDCKNYVEFVTKLREECCKKKYDLFVKFIDDNRAEMEMKMAQTLRSEQDFDDYMAQTFKSEQDFDDYMAERDEIVVAKATPDIVAKATPEIKKQTVIELYTEGLLSAEAAAKKLNMTVPAFLDLVKASV